MTHIGIDLSSFRIDYAWLDDKDHPVVHHQMLGNIRMPIQDRIREIDFLDGVREIWSTQRNCSSVIIEKPMGSVNIVSPLMAVVGAITAGIPKDVPVHWLRCNQLRAGIGAKNTKESAWESLGQLIPLDPEWDEHQKDALVCAVGGAILIEQGVVQSKKTPKRKRT